jgi:uncharacterized protein (DUF983 family)
LVGRALNAAPAGGKPDAGHLEPRAGATAPLLKVALGRRCPACGEGRLFKSYLKVAERCAVCGLDLSAQDSGDGPAVFIILILGFVVVGLALWVEIDFSPPLWLHALIWPPLILAGSLLALPVFKALLIALQYRHKSHERADNR